MNVNKYLVFIPYFFYVLITDLMIWLLEFAANIYLGDEKKVNN